VWQAARQAQSGELKHSHHQEEIKRWLSNREGLPY